MSRDRPLVCSAWPHHRPRRFQPAWVLVGLLHVVIVLSLWKLPVWADRTAPAPERPPLVVTLWERARVLSGAAKAPARTARRETPARPPIPEPQAITLPAAPSPAAAPAAPATPATPAAEAAVEAEPRPLNLALPRGASAPWRQRNPALDDPRSNTARLTMDQKLANAMGGDGSWVEERVDLDHVRFRRGNQCILATRTRAGQLELAGGAFRNSWTVREC